MDARSLSWPVSWPRRERVVGTAYMVAFPGSTVFVTRAVSPSFLPSPEYKTEVFYTVDSTIAQRWKEARTAA